MPDTIARVPKRLHQWLEPELFQPFVLGIFLCLSLSEFVRGALTLSLLPTYGRSVLHFRVEWTALALSLHYLVDNVLRTPSGWLVDHVGERSVLLTGFAISTASVFGMMNAHTVTWLIVSLCAYGVGANVVWPSVMSGIGRATPERKRALFMSYVYIFWLLGAGLGPVIINFLVGGTYRIAFWFLLSIDAVGFLTAFSLVRRSSSRKDRSLDIVRHRARHGIPDTGADVARDMGIDVVPDTDADVVRNAGIGVMRHRGRGGARVLNSHRRSVAFELGYRIARYGRFKSERPSLVLDKRKLMTFQGAYLTETAMELGLPTGLARKSDWPSMWRNIKEVAFLFPGMFAQTFAVASLIPILSVYANAVLKLSGAMYSLMLVAGGSITVIGLIPTGKLVDRIGPRTPLVVAFLTAGTGLALFPLFRTVPFTFGLVCLLGASYSFILPAWNAVLDKSIDEDKKGSLWGVFMTVEGFGSAAGPYLGGLMWDRVGPSAPFWVSATVILMMGLLYTVLPIEKRFRTRSVRA